MNFELEAVSGEYFAIVGMDANRPKSEAEFESRFKKLTEDAPKINFKEGETTDINLDYLR